MAEAKRPLKVFLCHSSNDKPVVRKLFNQLRADGVDAWLDIENLIPGQKWQIEIPKAVRESDVVMVCLSEQSVGKDGYVRNEIEFALNIADKQPEGTIFIIPARLEDCQAPDRLVNYQWVNLFEPDGYTRLLKALRKRAKDIDVLQPGKKDAFPLLKYFYKPMTFNSRVETPEKQENESGENHTTGKQSFFLKHRRLFIDAIGLISAILGVFIFLTGRENISQLFNWTLASMPTEPAMVLEQPPVDTYASAVFPSPVPTRKSTSTPNVTPIIFTETITLTPEPGYVIVDPQEVLNIAPNLRTLGQLAIEKYTTEQRNQINNTLTFTVNSTPEVPILWRWFWCALNDKILEQNMSKISIIFEADGYLIPEEQLATVIFENADPTLQGWKCRTYETVLRDWKSGTYELIQTMTISSAINDGAETFEAGYKIYEYTVTISK